VLHIEAATCRFSTTPLDFETCPSNIASAELLGNTDKRPSNCCTRVAAHACSYLLRQVLVRMVLRVAHSGNSRIFRQLHLTDATCPHQCHTRPRYGSRRHPTCAEADLRVVLAVCRSPFFVFAAASPHGIISSPPYFWRDVKSNISPKPRHHSSGTIPQRKRDVKC
jgi:hypothetical protein